MKFAHDRRSIELSTDKLISIKSNTPKVLSAV